MEIYASSNSYAFIRHYNSSSCVDYNCCPVGTIARSSIDAIRNRPNSTVYGAAMVTSMSRITHIAEDAVTDTAYEARLYEFKDQLQAMVERFILEPKQSKIAKIMDACQRYHDYFMEREIDPDEIQLVDLTKLEAYDSCRDGSLKEEFKE